VADLTLEVAESHELATHQTGVREPEKHLRSAGDHPGHEFHGNQYDGQLSSTNRLTLEKWDSGDATVYHDLRDPKTKLGQEATALFNHVPVFDGVSYRGLTLNDKDLAKLLNAKGVKIDLHSSASTDERVGQNFMSIADESHLGHDHAVLIEFHGRAADLRGSNVGSVADTAEVVVKAGTVYRFERLTHENGFERVTLKEKR
jgi:hypothetical protein